MATAARGFGQIDRLGIAARFGGFLKGCTIVRPIDKPSGKARFHEDDGKDPKNDSAGPATR
jgi:hypothetical protein